MKYCPTCQRKYPDLISTCPTDQTILTEPPPAGSEAKAAAAPALAKEPVDTRTLEEKLFAPLPKRAPETPAAAAKSPTTSPAVKAAVPAPTPNPGSTTKMMETVFEEPAQKSTRMAAVDNAKELPWNKIVPAVLAIVVIIAAVFIFNKSSSPPPVATHELGSSINPQDVDMEINVRDTLSQSAALRNQDIQVRVKDGTVVLSGEASSAAKIDQAVKAAKALPGVRSVVNHLQINPSVGLRSEGHAYSAGGLQTPQGSASDHGLAEQAKAHQLVLMGDRAASHGDYKAAAAFYKQALTLNPDDTAASAGYTQVMEKLQ